VSGDSWGKTCFWDGKTGTLLHSFAQHQSDVLCLATNKMHNKIFSAGIDNKTALFQLLDQEDGERKWVYTYAQRCHTHDM
jgi:U3 small nucleolar RNA-associated protein 4